MPRKQKIQSDNWIYAYYQGINNGTYAVGRWIRLVYEYIQENRESDYEVTWSEWLSAHNTQAAA